MTTIDSTTNDESGVLVRELAHARTGDKGNISDVGVFAYDQRCYDLLEDELTEEVVARELDDLVEGAVTRYEVPGLHAFKFVLEDALDGGVTKSLRVDRLGKSLSFAVLGIELDVSIADADLPDHPVES